MSIWQEWILWNISISFFCQCLKYIINKYHYAYFYTLQQYPIKINIIKLHKKLTQCPFNGTKNKATGFYSHDSINTNLYKSKVIINKTPQYLFNLKTGEEIN